MTPSGAVLPCHAAETIDGLRFDSVLERSLGEIWRDSEAFNRYRGTAWMPDPCRGCEHRERDWGGCRCQALALTGDAANTDPAVLGKFINTVMEGMSVQARDGATINELLSIAKMALDRWPAAI